MDNHYYPSSDLDFEESGFRPESADNVHGLLRHCFNFPIVHKIRWACIIFFVLQVLIVCLLVFILWVLHQHR